MGAMYRLKAYFGMVPAEELGEYVDEPVADRYPPRRTERVRDFVDDRWDERFAREDERESYDDEWDRRPPKPVAVERPAAVVRESVRGGGGLGPSAVRGSLAMNPDAHQEFAHREPVLREPSRLPERPVAAPAVPEQRERPATGAAAMARITTLQPRSYKEARTVGECYRDGQPVIMNLTELDAADAKRLVDFAAGLVFALRGGFDKVTNRVFLLTPADVEVSADDARMIAANTVSGTRTDTAGTERRHFRQD